jgi:uncharacterized membrane protein
MKIIKKEWLQILILAVPLCAAILLWDKLPVRMPIHWNMYGQADIYAGKAFAAFLFPCVNVGLVIFIMLLPRIDPKFAKNDEETKVSVGRTISAVRLSLSLFFSIVAMVVLAAPLHPMLRIPLVICAGFGLLLIVLGNLLTKLRPNYFCGFRTPWTLESRDVWIKTHRFGGRLMIAAGICVTIFSFVLPMKLLLFCVLIPAIAVIAIVPIAYSYFNYSHSRPE